LVTETEALYRALIERIPAATYVDGPDGTPVYVSPQIEELYGCCRDEWMRNTGVWQQRVHPEDRARVRAAWEASLREGREFSDEYRILMPDGAQRWVHEHSTPLRDDTGHVRVVQGVITDVTDRHRAEVAEARAEQVLREMLDAIPLAAVIEDMDGHIVYCNQHLVGVLGRRPEELLGKHWLDAVALESRRELERGYYDMLGRGEVMATSESVVPSRDNGERKYGWWTAPLLDPDGRPWGAASIGLDVTDHRVSEEALRESESRRRRVLGMVLRAEDAERSRIAVELHDDTVQVLTATLVSLDRLTHVAQRDDGRVDPSEVERVREIVYEATERTRRLMFELRPQLLEAQGLRVAVGARLEEAADESGLDVSLDAPAARYPAPVEDMVYRVVREAVQNVRKHAGARRIAVRLSEEGGFVHGRVTDDGRGFDPQGVRDRPRAYLHVGLDAVTERLWLAGGEFSIDARPGRGTEVRFAVPIARAEPGSGSYRSA
jgi:PAS domain S-box-containing protein